MSTIFGIINFDGQPVANETINTMLSQADNGENDYSGKLNIENAFFGQASFWTTPESKAEQQPITSRDGSLILVADARIDNRSELEHKLGIANSGSVSTDAELILLSFIKWLERCVDHLLGDYSFAIYNKLTKELFIVRDHLGFRPLYYLQSGSTFAFCSKIQPLLELGLVNRELDNEAFDYSLLLDAIPKDRTYYKHIKRLVGGTLSWLRKNKLTCSRYWKPEEYELRDNITLNDASDEFLEIFEQAVSARLRSAYPVGFELSGGLDSSSVALMANKTGIQQQWYPLSLRFGSMTCDEGNYIDAAKKIHKHPSIDVRADKLDFQNAFTLPWFYQDKRDWPADLFFLPHLVLASKASGVGVRVLLTGQGGDEVMQGSRWIYHDYLRKLNLIRAFEELSHSRSKKYDLLHYVIRPQLPDTLINMARFLKSSHYSNDTKKALAFSKSMANRLLLHDDVYCSKTAWDTARMLNGSEAALWRDSNPYNLYSNYNIEVRHPFFDIRLIKQRLTLPASYYYHNGEYKHLLRRAMKNILPEQILNRQDKADFGEIVIRQLNASKIQTNTISEALRPVISPQLWKDRKILHAKRGFDESEKFLAWKLLNIYHWIGK